MLPFFSENFGNPHSNNHQYGKFANDAVEDARKAVAELINAEKEASGLNKELKLQEVKLADLREEKVRFEGIITTHKETLKQISERIKEKLNCLPNELVEVGEINISNTLPSLEELENKLEKLNQRKSWKPTPLHNY